MQAQRVLQANRSENHQDCEELNQLHAELAAFNKRIVELEEAHPERRKIETLKAGAILVARRIDEVRCSGATRQLASLLTR